MANHTFAYRSITHNKKYDKFAQQSDIIGSTGNNYSSGYLPAVLLHEENLGKQMPKLWESPLR